MARMNFSRRGAHTDGVNSRGTPRSTLEPDHRLDHRTDDEAPRSGPARVPSLWLGGLVACLTALGLVVGGLSGDEMNPSAVAQSTAVASTATTPTAEATTPDATSDATPDATPAPAVIAPVVVAGASIPPLADLIARIGGPRVEVVSVVPQGVDGHTYEPTPSDVADLSRANVNFLASEDLNPSVTRTVAANPASGAMTVDLMALTVPESEVIADRAHSHGADGSHSHANVHVWTDPTIALRWVTVIRDQLTVVDPAGREDYVANAAAVSAQIEALHEATMIATATIPAPFRKLVVYHDSWSYFGRTYGFEVVGALQAADFAEPSAAEMARMIEQVRAAGVPAFFGAAVFPTEVLDRVSQEAGVPYVADLADDELPGQPGDAAHGYVGMMVENVRHIVTSLGGDASALAGVTL